MFGCRAEGDGEGVGDVRGFGGGLEAEVRFDGVLHLALRGVAVAGEAFLDLVWADLDELKAGVLDGEEDDAAGVGHGDGGGGVFGVGEELFDGDDGGFETGEEEAEVAVEFGEAGGDGGDVEGGSWEGGCVEGGGGGGAAESEDTGFDDGLGGGEGVEAAVAGEAEAGVDAEDAGGSGHWVEGTGRAAGWGRGR